MKFTQLLSSVVLASSLWLSPAAAFGDSIDEDRLDRLRGLLSGDRNLVSGVPCNSVIDELTPDEVRTLGTSVFTNLGQTPQTIAQLLFQVQFNVQVRKVCAACSDYESDFASVPGCTASDYGFNITQSGLAYVPIVVGTSAPPSGTLMPRIYMRGTQTDDSPILRWEGANTTYENLDIVIPVIMSASMPITNLLPEFMGYGESFGAFRAFFTKKTYVTATLPLIKQLQMVFVSDFACDPLMGDEFLVAGVSEGAYAAVAVAESLETSMGYTVNSYQGGGGIYDISKVHTPAVYKKIDGGTFRRSGIYFLAYFGAAFSSTIPGLPNYGIQDLLIPQYRDDLVNLVVSGTPWREINSWLEANVTSSDILSVFDPNVNAAFRSGVSDPCNNAPGEPGVICQAVQQQDLAYVLDTASYPVQLCHSSEDNVSGIENMQAIVDAPHVSKQVVTGSHLVSLFTCNSLFLGGALQALPALAGTFSPLTLPSAAQGLCPTSNTVTGTPTITSRPTVSPAPTAAPTTGNGGTMATMMSSMMMSMTMMTMPMAAMGGMKGMGMGK